MKRFQTLMLAIALVGLIGCGSSGAAPATGPSTPAATSSAAEAEKPAIAPGEAQVGDRTTCPVSGDTFVVKADSPKVEHEGKSYYFCCPGCDAQFEADPDKYLQKK